MRAYDSFVNVVLLLPLSRVSRATCLQFALHVFRKAKLLPNLVYVERYKQASLCQDLVGKHNGSKVCVVYDKRVAATKCCEVLMLLLQQQATHATINKVHSPFRE